LVKGNVDHVARKRRKIQKKATIINSSPPKPSSPAAVPKEIVPPKENTLMSLHDEPVANPFDGNEEDLPIPTNNNTQVSKIIQDLCSDSIDISYINNQLKELKKQLADS
jgi:hypothetical protein